MLDRAFQRRFFNLIDEMTDAQLDERIEAVQIASKDFVRGTEAASDSYFMLRHMRRIRTERLFRPQKDKVVH